MGTGFNFKPPAALAPNKRVSQSFEALKAGIDFSSLAVKVLDGLFFQLEPGRFPYIKNMLFRATTFVSNPSQIFWMVCCSFSIGTGCFTLLSE